MERSPLIVQAETALIPAVLVLVILTSCIDPGDPAIVMAPLPPNIILPVLVKEVPASWRVTGVVGLKFNLPLLVTAPLLVNEPRIVWVDTPPLKLAPLPILKATNTVQPTLGLIPPLLL